MRRASQATRDVLFLAIAVYAARRRPTGPHDDLGLDPVSPRRGSSRRAGESNFGRARLAHICLRVAATAIAKQSPMPEWGAKRSVPRRRKAGQVRRTTEKGSGWDVPLLPTEELEERRRGTRAGLAGAGRVLIYHQEDDDHEFFGYEGARAASRALGSLAPHAARDRRVPRDPLPTQATSGPRTTASATARARTRPSRPSRPRRGARARRRPRRGPPRRARNRRSTAASQPVGRNGARSSKLPPTRRTAPRSSARSTPRAHSTPSAGRWGVTNSSTSRTMLRRRRSRRSARRRPPGTTE